VAATPPGSAIQRRHASAINKALPCGPASERWLLGHWWTAKIVRSVCVARIRDARVPPCSGSGKEECGSKWLGHTARRGCRPCARADRQGSQKECVPTCRRARTRDVIGRHLAPLLCDVLLFTHPRASRTRACGCLPPIIGALLFGTVRTGMVAARRCSPRPVRSTTLVSSPTLP
jgi:hypothetical protein